MISLLGDHDATRLIEGAQGSYEIVLNSNDSNSMLHLLNKTFILVMISEGNYYFTEKCIPAPSRSTLYAVPVNKIELAKIDKVVPRSVGPNLQGSYIQPTGSIK